MKTPFPIIPALCAVAIAYRNQDLIADQVLPYVRVGKREFYYMDYTGVDSFTVPENEVGRKSAPNEVEFSAEKKLASVKDYALKDKIPQGDIDAAGQEEYSYDPLARSTEGIMALNKLAREVRAARMVFNPATYPDANRIALAAGSKFSDATGDPITVINRGLETPVLRPNTMVIGQTAWTALRTNPAICKAVNRTDGDKGIASKQEIANLFEVKDIVVGQGWVNAAKKGQPRNLVRVWGSHLSLLYLNPNANTDNDITFGFTPRYGNPWGGAMFDKDIGPQGGQEVRAGESCRELIIAPDLGYFVENAA
ncbi:hypothetical protein GURASL_13570 [Geotalea uraniireducens]|uniref:Major capsid protein n=1 Tax=Geotalea uraniireducens TaxID=351604 RepID=A0ABM8EIY0_9BACT|nr:hypothetical protein [Geotalea uraniireducens]BDV42434.1 hypothetical protein GURASL_13570 [Geotalea uraniireducens]